MVKSPGEGGEGCREFLSREQCTYGFQQKAWYIQWTILYVDLSRKAETPPVAAQRPELKLFIV